MNEPTRLSHRFDDALSYAVELHRTQERKGSRVPYVGHLLGAAATVLHFGGSEDAAIGALLHDAAEDQGGRKTLEDIRARFGEGVARIVEGCTDSFEEQKGEWRARKEAYVAGIGAKDAQVRLVSAADKLDNARAIVADLRAYGPVIWERFSAGTQSLWYYRALVDAFRQAGGGPIVAELDAAVSDMERLAEQAHR